MALQIKNRRGVSAKLMATWVSKRRKIETIERAGEQGRRLKAAERRNHRDKTHILSFSLKHLH